MALERAKAQAGAELGQVQDVINALLIRSLPERWLSSQSIDIRRLTALQVLAAEQQKMMLLNPRAQ